MTETEIIATLQKLNRPTDDATAIKRYARALALAERAWHEIPADSLVGKTDRTGQRVHPSLAAWLAAERFAVESGRQLGLEINRAAKNPGGQLGVPHAPDRKAEPPRLVRAVK